MPDRGVQAKVVDFLQNGFDIPLRDPLWGHVYLNKAFQKLIHTKPFLHLGNIRQLSSATLVYPGSRHTRFEHSIGVFWMARRLLHSILCNKNSEAAEFCPTLHGSKAFLAAALLHDLGHFPYAHVLEGLKIEHEEISARYILSDPLAKILSDDLGTDPKLVAALVDESQTMPEEYSAEGDLYRSLLSGTLDPDKLDYLNRDAYYCGVPYGIQDLEYLFSQVHLCRVPSKEDAGVLRLCIPERGLTIIESLIFSRYLMYRTVYWHRNVRALSAPIVEAAGRALERGLIDEEQIFRSNDLNFPELFRNLDMPERELCLQAQEPRNFVAVDEVCLGKADPNLLNNLRQRSQRLKLTEQLCGDYGLQPWQVMLDLTGPQKMNIRDIFVSQPLGIQHPQGIIPFMQSSTVLQQETLDRFRESLTMLRLVLPVNEAQQVKPLSPLNPLAKFLESRLTAPPNSL